MRDAVCLLSAVSSEMMNTQGGERAVVGLVAIGRRLSEEAKVKRRQMQQGHRHCACRIEQGCALMGGA
jgi:hypothetical protein